MTRKGVGPDCATFQSGWRSPLVCGPGFASFAPCPECSCIHRDVSRDRRPSVTLLCSQGLCTDDATQTVTVVNSFCFHLCDEHSKELEGKIAALLASDDLRDDVEISIVPITPADAR